MGRIADDGLVKIADLHFHPTVGIRQRAKVAEMAVPQIQIAGP